MNELKLHKISLRNKIKRFIWGFIQSSFFRFSPRQAHFFRVFLLKIFGANIGSGVHIYPKAKIWAPWNLAMESNSSIDDYVDCYNVAPIKIGANTAISRYVFLCTATHDYSKKNRPLLISPIKVGSKVWIAADVFVGPGVTINNNSVILARVFISKDVPRSVVVRQKQNYLIKKREHG
jgi:putative colanic acid biosynthesis acetyltransferase WcaF